MGHSSILITQRYAHMGDTELADAARETGLAPMPVVADEDPSPDTERNPAAWDAAS